MASNNILYICNAMLQNVVIMTDSNGKNELDSLGKYKYHQRLIKRDTNNLKNDCVLINDKTYSNCIIIVDELGNNVLKCKDEISNKNVEENNLFIKVLKQVQLEKEPSNIEAYLLKKRESLQSKLHTATYYFNTKSYDRACALYNEVLTIIETDMYPDEFMLKDTDILAIKFGYALSKMAICKSSELRSAADLLTVLKTGHGDEFPTLYYYLARCLFLLENFQDAKYILEIGQNKLKDIEFLNELNWPGSDNKMIVKTEKSLLEENIRSLLKECNEFKLPDIKCLYHQCENKNIFFDSLCFNGYVIVKCSRKCNFTYHRNCWKMKLKNDCIKKPICFLGNLCATDDCGGNIFEILIYDKNLHLKQKITDSPDKHEEKAITSNDKTTKKSLNDKPSKVTSNKSKSDNKIDLIEKTKETVVLKTEKKQSLNLNAKEYVPANKQSDSLQLNTSAKEYIPPTLNSIRKEGVERSNLFDMVPNCEIPQGINEFAQDASLPNDLLISKNAPIVTYSQEDQVSIDFESVSDVSSSSNMVHKLKSEVCILQSQLFQSEEAYNNMLAQNHLLQKKLQESIAKPKSCENCTQMQNLILKKESDCATATLQLKKLEESNASLTNQLKELQNAMHLQQQENQLKADFTHSVVQKNKIFQQRIDELISKMKVMAQQHAYNNQQNNAHLRKALFDQINCIRHAYESYFTMYENKCKHTLWELEEVKDLSTADTSPTKAEIEENIGAWSKTLENALNSRFMMQKFYEHLFSQFSNELTGNECPIPISFPSFIVEPPNIIMRHFKSLIIVNKRLEQELHQQLNDFYKMISTPYPGVFPQKESSLDAAAAAVAVAVPTTVPVSEKNPAVLQNNTSENVSELHYTGNHKKESNLSNWASTSATDLKVPNMYDNLVNIPAVRPFSRKITKQSLLKENISMNKCDGAPIGTIPKNKNKTSQSSENSSMQNHSKFKPDIVGQESLINKLHEKLPLVPIELISRAVNILRERSGGLTGKDSKQIITEIKQIMKEIAITEKCLRKTSSSSKELPIEKPIKTWKKVNNGIHWNNDDPDVNCTICFEFMAPGKRIKLRCQHIFHTTCIKLWLQNDSICPICRSFATLDDEFPPLK